MAFREGSEKHTHYEEREHMEAMNGIPEEIAERQIALFTQVHPEYGAGVRAARARLAAG